MNKIILQVSKSSIFFYFKINAFNNISLIIFIYHIVLYIFHSNL